MKLEFDETLLQVRCPGFEIPKKQPLIQEDVNKLLKKWVVVVCEHEAIEYISPIFFRKKTDGTLKLERLYKYLEDKYFKWKHVRRF